MSLPIMKTAKAYLRAKRLIPADGPVPSYVTGMWRAHRRPLREPQNRLIDPVSPGRASNG